VFQVRSPVFKVTIAEYGTPEPVIAEIAAATRSTPSEAEALLRRHGERLQRRHGLKENPIEIRKDGVTAKGIAGVIALTPRTELEIRPKFAAPGSDWQADLVFLAVITKHGHIDTSSSISSLVSEANSLADLVARIVIRSIERNRRAPLRTRRVRTIESFEPEGEMEPDVLLNPGEEGWRQHSYTMSRDNEYWSTIHRGALVLLPHVRNVEIAARLTDTVTRWGRPVTPPSRFHRLLPPRLSVWQSSYDLCFELAQGASTSHGAGPQATFEFTLDMWRAWETLIERGLVAALGAARVDLQKETNLGILDRNGRISTVTVIPDAVVDVGRPLVVDAKYKGRWRSDGRGYESISTADRYEAMAFMMATGAKDAILLYPSLEGVSVDEPLRIVQREELPTGNLIAVAIGVSGLSRLQGMTELRSRLKEVIALTNQSIANA
jgi:5-methylcytosine-specific restriction enzyme subunit McrC